MHKENKLIEIKGLKKYFNVNKGLFSRKQGYVKAVDDVSFDIYEGETVGLVGESGCGKTTLGRTILRIYEPTAGEALFRGKNIFSFSENQMLCVRRKMQMIFQDPYSSLNPRMTVSDIVAEPLLVHGLYTPKNCMERVCQLLDTVGLNPENANRFPHEFSGGQRQRIGIARALAVEPDFIICDEPISALDVSIQAQIVNKLQELQESMGLTYLFIAHDLSMVKHISNRIVVMYLGKIMEVAQSNTLYNNPLHPYTQALLSAIPVPDPIVEKKRRRILLEGDIPSPLNPPTGCRFKTRCPYAKDVCSELVPELTGAGDNHMIACHRFNEI
jgi:oligopeptide transport system ATP-binding protein